MIDVDSTLVVIEEDGTEKEMTILFTFDSEDYKKSYVLFYDEADEEEIIAASYDDKGNLFEVEDEQEWQMVNEMLEMFNNEEFEYQEEETKA